MPRAQSKESPVVSIFSYNKLNPFVRFLTLSDILMNSGFGLMAPILAIFITDNIRGANIETVGIAATVFLVTKCLVQVFIGTIIDKIKGEKDDALLLLVGMFIYSLIPLMYIFIGNVWQLYLVQFIYGVAAAFAYPTWMAIFSRHLDKKHEGVEWGMYATFVEFGMAFTAALGGFVAYNFSFNHLFVLAAILIFAGNSFVFLVYARIRNSGRNRRVSP